MGTRRAGEDIANWAALAEQTTTAVSAPLPGWAFVSWTLEIRLAKSDPWKLSIARMAVVDANVERLG